MRVTAQRGCWVLHRIVVAVLALAGGGSLFLNLPLSSAFSVSNTPPSSPSSSSSSTSTMKEDNPTTTTKVRFRGLDPSAIRHPLDRQLTDLTDQIVFFPFGPLAQDTVRSSYNVVEQIVRLDLLSTSVKVSKTQLPHLHKSLEEVCEILDLGGPSKPDLFVQSSPQANAYTLAIQSSTSSFLSTASSSSSSSSSISSGSTRPIIVLTSALVDRCTQEEIQAVIGHECGHIKCEHSLWLTLGNVLATSGLVLPGTKLLLRKVLDGKNTGLTTTNLVSEWRLAAEYTCDRAALLVSQDPQIVNSAMLKLTSGTSQTTNIDAFIEQSQEYDDLLSSLNNNDDDDRDKDKDKDDSNPTVAIEKSIRSTIRRLVASSQQQQRRTHPLPINRVVELDKWSKSHDYQRLVKVATLRQQAE